MQKDTVLLSVKEYNELRTKSSCDFFSQKTIYYTESEIILDFEKEILKLEYIIELLRKEKEEISDIKRMSYWEFRKWKKA